MHVERIGFTAVKGGQHRTRESVLLTPTGPRGDRAFCLIDPRADRCLRTVEHPTLLQTAARWDGTVLSVELPSGTVSGAPVLVGEARTVDYWGRRAIVHPVDGPWAAAYSAHLGREVVLGATAPGQVVYGASVTLVSSSSLAHLAQEAGGPVAPARLRSTFELDTGDLPPFAEDGWSGRRVRLGTAEVKVRGAVPRCAVIDLNPGSGVRDLGLMKALARCHRVDGEVALGVDADVIVPGRVRSGDRVELAPARGGPGTIW